LRGDSGAVNPRTSEAFGLLAVRRLKVRRALQRPSSKSSEQLDTSSELAELAGNTPACL